MKKLFFWGKKGISFLTILSMMASICMPFALYPSVAKAAAVVGPNNGGTFTNNSTDITEGIDWSNPSNAQTSDDTWATVSLRRNQKSNYLKATNFGFTIPDGSTINGIELSIERNNENGNADKIFDHSIRLVKNGTITGNNQANESTAWPVSD